MGYYPELARLLNEYLYQQRGATQAWLAGQLCITPGTVSRWLEGVSRPDSPELIIQIADVLAVYDHAKRQELLFAAGYGYVELVIMGDRGGNSTKFLKPAELVRLEKIRNCVLPLFEHLNETPFSDHSVAHVNRALHYFEALLEIPATTERVPLSSLEVFIAETAIVLHNVGFCFSAVSNSTYLQERYNSSQLNTTNSLEQFMLYSQHWHELSIEMIVGSISEKQRYPDLGLSKYDPVDIITDLVRYLPVDAPDLPEEKRKAIFLNQSIRLHLLIHLVRLALSLEFVVEVPGRSPAPSAQEDIQELKIRQWMRYYIEGIVLEKHSIGVYWKVPSPEYTPHITNAYYEFFVRRWIEMIDPLLVYGWVIVPKRIQIECKEYKERMSTELFALLHDETYLKEKLRLATNVLASFNDELPYIAPYYYGAVLDVSKFIWDGVTDEKTIYKVTLWDRTTNQVIWQKTDIKSSSLLYPDSPLLEPQHRYRWAIQTYKEGWLDSQWLGDFWLLDQVKQAELIIVGTTFADKPEAERQLAMGILYALADTYGLAVKCLQQAIMLEHSSEIGIMARRTLADLYERLYQILKNSERRSEANTFLLMAESQYKILRQLCSV